MVFNLKINKNIFLILLYIALISVFYLATTNNEMEIVKKSWDKLNHLAAFAVLYLLIEVVYKKGFGKNFVVLMCFGILIEVVQYFIPSRDFTLLDIIANGVGIIVGYCFFLLYKRYRVYSR